MSQPQPQSRTRNSAQKRSSRKGALNTSGQSALGAWAADAEFWKGAAALLILCLVAYATVLRPSAGFVWDDVAITDSRVVQSPGGLLEIWFNPLANTHEQHYWPLTYTTFWLEHKLWGLRAPGFHAVNVLLHAANCLLLWRLLRRFSVPGAWFAGALFAVHPVHAESVAWVIERKDVLSGLFYLLAFHFHLDFWETGRRSRQWGALTLFVAGMLSKSIVVTLPVALLLVRWWKNGRMTLQDVIDTAPMLFAGFLIGALDSAFGATYFPDRFEIPFLSRLLMAPVAFWFYAGKLFWPLNQMAIYPKWPLGTGEAAGYLAWGGILILVAGLWALRGKIGRGPLTAVFFYGITLAPILGIVAYGFLRYAYVADRYQYLASIGPLALFAATAVKLAGSRIPKVALRGAGAVLLVVLSVLTLRHAEAYGNAEMLWSRNLHLNSNAWEAHQQLGRLLAVRGLATEDQKLTQEGMDHLRKSIRLEPGFYQAHFNLGTALHASGRFAEAEAEFRKALQFNPDFAPAHNGLGAVLAQTGRYAEAISHLQEALEIDPHNAEAAENLMLAQEEMAAGQQP